MTRRYLVSRLGEFFFSRPGFGEAICFQELPHFVLGAHSPVLCQDIIAPGMTVERSRVQGGNNAVVSHRCYGEFRCYGELVARDYEGSKLHFLAVDENKLGSL